MNYRYLNHDKLKKKDIIRLAFKIVLKITIEMQRNMHR